ncbi:MAG: HIT family protein [Granulosicoccus sp.]
MSIDPRLVSDTLLVCESHSASIRLMNDSRWPWLILIPHATDATELHELPPQVCSAFLADVNQTSRLMKQETGCTSVNIAMLGNVVSQLHCHVVARNHGDPNWPAPVWGFEKATPYNADLPQTLLAAVVKSFS